MTKINAKEFYPSDLYELSHELTTGELEVLSDLRKTLDETIMPVIDEHWEKAEFPFDQFASLAPLQLLDNDKLFEERPGKKVYDKNFVTATSPVYNVFKTVELAKHDASIATFYTVHTGLFLQTILQGGSPEQIDRWAKKAMDFEIQGCFALTEPEHGSDVAGGLATTAEKIGDEWVINGEKRWIGGAATANEMAVFARDVADGKVKAFMVPGDSEGITVEKIEEKIALRLVQNGHITFKDVKVTDDRRLVNVNSFKDVAHILGITRGFVTDLATGITMGAFEYALKYVKERDQFGKKIASYQLVQEKLARIQANVVANLSYSINLAKLQDRGIFAEQNSSIGKMHNAMRMRESVALARELCGGNGITLETGVARMFADAEAIYSYEGTHEINALIIGRFLTGKQAFV